MDHAHDGNSYKQLKEAFVSHNDGNSVLDINKLCWTAVTTYQLWQAAQLYTLSNPSFPGSRIAAAEYIILVLPLILVLTVFANHPIYFNMFLYGLIILASGFTARLTGQKKQEPSAGRHSQTQAYSPFHKFFVTVWRAHMMLMTVICILAVDFPAFPRSFGKTETWGTSLMDLGVGSFVFSLGLTSAPALLKRAGQRNPRSPSLLTAIRRTWIILLLGFVRLAMVKGTEYPEHVTEYGVHWNFFFTLALLPIFGSLMERWVHIASFKYMALAVTAAHQLLLVVTPLQVYTLNGQRPNILAQNKEGLVSFAGYLAIYMMGYDTGLYVLPPDPYYMRKREKHDLQQKPALGKLMNVLFSYAVLWWAAFGIFRFVMPEHLGVSRRLANTSYVLWVTAFNVSFLCLNLAVELLGNKQGIQQAGPAIFEALNRNSLAIFLLANILTGLINVSMQTMYASNTRAVFVLVAYSSILVAFAWRFRKIRLKL